MNATTILTHAPTGHSVRMRVDVILEFRQPPVNRCMYKNLQSALRRLQKKTGIVSKVDFHKPGAIKSSLNFLAVDAMGRTCEYYKATS